MTVIVAIAVTLPTTVVAGQASALSWATVQRGVALGSPIIPGGRPIVRSFTCPPLKSMWRWTLLWAPACVLAGAATRPLRDSACAEAGTASSAAAAMTIPIRRLGVRLMPLRSFPLWLLANCWPRCPEASICRSTIFGRRFDRVRPLQGLRLLAHADHLGRDAAHHGVGGHVPGDHRVGAHDRVVADRHPAQDAGAISDP